MPLKTTNYLLSAQRIKKLICAFIPLLFLQLVDAQYSFLPIQYPEYQALINPAVAPFENVLYDDQFIGGFHQRWSSERWSPQLDNNQQRLAYANLKLNEFNLKPLNPYRSLDMGGHLHLYEENNGAASLSAIYSGGIARISPGRWLRYRNQFSIYAGFNIGLIQHRVDYSEGIDKLPSIIRSADFSSKLVVDAGGGLKIQYKSPRYGITGLFSTPVNYGINAAYHDDTKTDFAFAGIQQYHAGIHFQYLSKPKLVYKSYMQFNLQTVWNQTGDLLHPNLSFEYGFNRYKPILSNKVNIQMATFNLGFSPGRESQIYRADQTDTPVVFVGLTTSLPIYSIRGQYLNVRLSYKFITDIVNDFSGQSAHALGLAFSLNRLLKYNPNPYWNDRGLLK